MESVIYNFLDPAIFISYYEIARHCLDRRHQWLTGTCTLIRANQFYLQSWWSAKSLPHLASANSFPLNGTAVHVMCCVNWPSCSVVQVWGRGTLCWGDVSLAVRLLFSWAHSNSSFCETVVSKIDVQICAVTWSGTVYALRLQCGMTLRHNSCLSKETHVET